MTSLPTYAVLNPDTNPESVSGFYRRTPIDSRIPTNIPTTCRDSRWPDYDDIGNPQIRTLPQLTIANATVFEAHNFDPSADVLAQLVALNLQIAANVEASIAATVPCVPTICEDQKDLITDHCIEPG